jgi:transglutaminase-like putative cysteine protease
MMQMMFCVAALATTGPSPAIGADGGTGAPLSVQPSELFLAAFPVETRLSGPLFPPDRIKVTLFFDAAAARSSNELVRRRRIPLAPDGRLAVDQLSYPDASDKPGRQHARPSFLIDFDEPPMKAAVAEARGRIGEKPAIEALVQFVDRYIARKGLGRGYDIASVVARRREGDCTEHAVFLTAMARAFRIPARVVQGIVLTEEAGRVFAFGHAWTEVHRGGKWQVADAAFPSGGRLVYLPLELVTDETAGFALGITASAAGTIGVRKIAVQDRDRSTIDRP